MNHRYIRRVAAMIAAGLVSGGLTFGVVPEASAATRVDSFASIDSTPLGCTGARINGISESKGVRYYYHGKRLRFPTRVLPYNKLGIINLKAKAKRGYTLTKAYDQLLAPAECFTAFTVGSVPRGGPVQSWCKGDASPELRQLTHSDQLEGATVSWRVVRLANHKVVARGTAEISLGEGEIAFPLPAGLPLGKYVVTLRNTASAKTLFPYSMRAEQYRCMGAPTVKQGAVTFKVPAGGPNASIDIYDGPPQAPSANLVVRAGHRGTYRTTSAHIEYIAYPTGNHVGTLGYGGVDIPQG